MTQGICPGKIEGTEKRNIVEAVEIAWGLARKIVESRLEHGDPLPPALSPLALGGPVDLVYFARFEMMQTVAVREGLYHF